MKERILIVYDDTSKKNDIIRDVIGTKGFGEVIVKKKRLDSYFKASIEKYFSDFEWKTISSIYEFKELAAQMEQQKSSHTKILHCFSNFIISDAEKASFSFKKIEFIEKPYAIKSNEKIVAVMFDSVKSYSDFLSLIHTSIMDSAKNIEDTFCAEGFIDISVTRNFIQCIAGNFDARFFNSLSGDEYSIIKSSTNKKKIRSEYQFYHLLPEDMKSYFVMPFNYQEDENKASYTMERLHTTDLAIKWVHGSIDSAEFSSILDKYFHFFDCRHIKEVSKEEYKKISDALYVEKVKERIDMLQKMKEAEKILAFMNASCSIKDMNSLFEKYLLLKNKVEMRTKYKYVSVIGHGDPCFANVLYNRATELLKFIDPKGALTEKDLWTNPYYDIAKLSHSICGLYDFFNNGLFDIFLDETFSLRLHIDFDNSKYKKIFYQKLCEHGFDILSVRIYEASLFISMLPLHIDNTHKVFGFILNSIRILEEIENELSK